MQNVVQAIAMKMLWIFGLSLSLRAVDLWLVEQCWISVNINENSGFIGSHMAELNLIVGDSNVSNDPSRF